MTQNGNNTGKNNAETRYETNFRTLIAFDSLNYSLRHLSQNVLR